MKKIEGNSNRTLLSKVYDNSIVQTFNPNVRTSYFENLEYILPIIDFLDVEISETLAKALIAQFQRDCVHWNGEILVENLLLLNKFNVKEFFSLIFH